MENAALNKKIKNKTNKFLRKCMLKESNKRIREAFEADNITES